MYRKEEATKHRRRRKREEEKEEEEKRETKVGRQKNIKVQRAHNAHHDM